ncbi:MAG: AI-2E family transporter [Candidatus Aminicenantes bacterium]|nr:AI-2E family transporter [Candidatus Aminicenantes bacterium]
MENNKILLASSGVALIFLIGLILRLAKPVLFPFFLAVFFYFILSPPLETLLRLKIPRPLAVFLIVVTSFVILYLLGILFYNGGKAFAVSLPDYAQKISGGINAFVEKLRMSRLNWDPGFWSKSLDSSRITSLFLQALNQIFSLFSLFILVFVFLIFMLAGRGKLQAKVQKSLSPQRAEKINGIIERIDHDVQKYLSIKTGISVLSGIITTVVLLAFGVEFAVLFGILTAILNFIPSLGSIVSMGLITIIAVFQFGSLFPAFWILLILVALDVVIPNLLEPKLMGQGLGLSPLVVLFSLFFWGWLWGIPGMILAVPLMAVIKIICSNIPALESVALFMSK